jgi:hypothetical protein
VADDSDPNEGAPGGRDDRGWLAGMWDGRYAVLHHVLLAATIASVTILLEQMPFFGAFDIVTRGLLSYAQAWKDERIREETLRKGFRIDWNPDAAGDRPLVIFVEQFPAQASDARMHPTRFAAELIRAVASQRPAALAIDLELDPFFDDPRLNDPRCDYLAAPTREAAVGWPRLGPCEWSADPDGRALRASLDGRAGLLQVLHEAANVTPVVVTAPPLPLTVKAFDRVVDSGDPVEERILARRLGWMLDLCGMPNVRVALRLPEKPTGITFTRNVPTLGNVVWQVTRSPRPPFDVRLVQFTPDVVDGCAPFRAFPTIRLVSGLAETRELVHRIARVAERPGPGSVGTISSRYYETLANGFFVNVRSRPPGAPVGDLVPRGLRDRIVFLGDDGVLTKVLHLDHVPAVDYHAAVFYSNLHGAFGLKHAAAFLLDVALGSLLGILLTWSWRAYGRARVRMDQMSAATVRGLLAKAPLYLRARGVLLGNLVLLGGLTWVMFAAANVLLRHDVWINPLPLVVGMSIKGLLASRQPHAGHELRDWWAFYNRHPDVLLQIPVIVVSIGLVWFWGH